MTSAVDTDFFHDNGYLRVQGVFDQGQTDELAAELDDLIEQWSFEAAWTGPWRDA